MMDAQFLSPKRMDYSSGRESRDFISDLPLAIIHMILELVPTPDAIRTSILSKQWRYTWTTLPQLVFSGIPGDSLYKDEDRLINAINQALTLHKAPIHKFQVDAEFKNSCPNIDQWLLHLSNDLRELDLSLLGYWDVPSSLYSCQKITHLALRGFMCLDPPPPMFKGFLCLRCLDLCICESSDFIESLVASCPLLEDLKIEEWWENFVVRIKAPNLKYLKLGGAYEEISVYAPLLVKMSVELTVVDDEFTAGHYLEQESWVCNYTELLGGLTNLESLSGDEYFTKYLRIGIEVCQDSLVFHHLKVISLHNVNSEDKKEISVVVRLIMDSPNLHTLEISVRESSTYRYIKNASEGPNGSFWDSGCAPNSTLTKLRVIKMVNVHGLPHEMEFIKFLLKSSPVLETITLDRPYVCAEVWLDFTNELVRYGQAESPNAEILYKPLKAF